MTTKKLSTTRTKLGIKTYSTEARASIVEHICDELIAGKSMRQICSPDDMPNFVTIIKWMNGDDEIANTIARARQFQADTLYDDIQAITQDTITGKLDAQTAKVAIWAKQWSAGRMKPKKYGDTRFIEQKTKVSFEDMSDEDIARELASLSQQIETAQND